MSTFADAIKAGSSALAAERTRIEVSVSNIANAESTRGPRNEPYRRRDVVLEPQAIDTFDAALGRAHATGVRVVAVVEDQEDFQRRYEPSHPDADETGFVALPNIDLSEEVVNMLSAARAYQANIAAIGLVRQLARRALDLAE